MNVRLFLLVATTALFVAIWSSDQQYQETQLAQARAARKRAAEQETASAKRRVAPDNRPAVVPKSVVPRSVVATSAAPTLLLRTSLLPTSLVMTSLVRTAPFAAASPVAPLIAVRSSEEPIREPVVAPPIVRKEASRAVLPTPAVAMIMPFCRRSFRLDASRPLEDAAVLEGADRAKDAAAKCADRATSLEADLARLLRWANRVLFEINGETCWMRWQMQRRILFTERRLAALLRRQVDEVDLVEKPAAAPLPSRDGAAAVRPRDGATALRPRDGATALRPRDGAAALRPLDAAANNSAGPGAAEKR